MALARHEFVPQDAQGNALTDAEIEVVDEATSLPALLFIDRDGTDPLDNPFSVDAITGLAAFHAIGGAYRITVTSASAGSSFTRRYQGVGTYQEADEPVFGALALEDDASGVPFTPTGGLAAANVQAALEELDTEKEPADATILKEANVQHSIDISGGNLQLENDEASPGAYQVYGTDVSGVKGWQPSPASAFLIAEADFSNNANVDIPIDGQAWDYVIIDVMNLVPQTDNTILYMRVSQSAAFLAGTSDYQWGYIRGGNTATNATDSELTAVDAIGNNTLERLLLRITIFRPTAASFAKTLHWAGGFRASNAANFDIQGWGELILNTDAIEDFRLIMSSGNIASGRYRAVGYRHS